MKMKMHYNLLVFAFLMVFSTYAQENVAEIDKTAKRYMQEAEEALGENNPAMAEAFYRKAIAIDPTNAEARYNLGNLYYTKGITTEAVQRHGQAAEVAETKALKHNSFHNRGNAFMKQKKYKEAVEAYKNSLRNYPDDEETRYNLALAQKMLKEEEKKGGGGKDQKEQKEQNKKEDQQKDQKQNQGDKDQQKDGDPQDKPEGEKEKKDQQEGKDQKDNEGEPQKKQPNEGDKENKQKQPQKPTPGQLSPQQIKNILEAMGNEEKKIQDKINAKKVEGAKTSTGKDW